MEGCQRKKPVKSLVFYSQVPRPSCEEGRENEGPKTGEFSFHDRLWQKFSLKVENSAHNWNRQHVNSLLFIDEPGISPLGAAVQLLFCLPPVWAFPPLIWAFRFQHFSTGFLSFLFRYLFSSSQTECVFLPPVWAFPSSHLGLSHPLIWGLPFTSFLRPAHHFPLRVLHAGCWNSLYSRRYTFLGHFSKEPLLLR